MELTAAKFHKTLILYSFWVSPHCCSWRAHWDSALLGLPNAVCGQGSREEDIESAQSAVLLGRLCCFLLIKHKFKDKIILDFKMVSRPSSPALGPSECRAQGAEWIEDPWSWPGFSWALSLLPHSGYCSVHTLITPIPPLLPGSHRHSSSSFHLLNVQTRTQTSFCILSFPKVDIHHQSLFILLPKRVLNPHTSHLCCCHPVQPATLAITA